ncbi:MAG: GNVR domain-containing protein [Gemmatimonadales bacterium]
MEPLRTDQDSASYVGELLVFAMRRGRWLVGLPLFTGLVAAVISLLLSFSYTSLTTFVPESEAGRSAAAGSLAGIASQFGLALPTSGQNSPQFFAQVLSSRTLKSALLETRFPDRRKRPEGDSATLIRIIGSTGIEAGMRDIDNLSRIDVDPRTNIVSVSVTTPWAALSAEVANKWIELLNRFNTETRRQNASELRKFIESRLTQSQSELHAAEGEVRAFLERNRIIAAPALQEELSRLQRQVTIKQEVYLTQLRQLEDARVAEVNNVALITVIDRAVPPEVRSGPRRTRNTFIGALIGFLVGLTVALVLEYGERLRGSEGGAMASVRTEWDRLRGSFGRRRRAE